MKIQVHYRIPGGLVIDMYKDTLFLIFDTDNYRIQAMETRNSWVLYLDYEVL